MTALVYMKTHKKEQGVTLARCPHTAGQFRGEMMIGLRALSPRHANEQTFVLNTGNTANVDFLVRNPLTSCSTQRVAFLKSHNFA
jgi:hypothetical protein